jgi:serine protease Do
MKQNSKRKTRVIVYTLFGVLLGVFLTYGILYKFPKVFQETITKIEKDVTVTDEGIADAVEKVYNYVVVISTYKKETQYASGSGFIYKVDNKEMYIITNYHVIAEGDNFKVTYIDGEVVEAKLLGGDQYSDIAVLSVKLRSDMKAVELGKTSTLRVGDTTFTVGAPLDNVYSWTVTRGIISGKERFVEVSLSNAYGTDYVMNVLQTDAAVNSGNSGGPLCNSNGDVIGVINAKISSAGVEGMGFAIPIEDALNVAGQLRSNGKVTRPFLGVSMTTVAQAYRAGIDLDSSITSGAVIVEVQKDSASDKAGLKKGDVITKFGDYEIKDYQYLKYYLYRYNVGDEIAVTYIRDGKEKTTTMTLKES